MLFITQHYEATQGNVKLFSADDDVGMVVLLLLLYIPWEELNSNQNVFIFSWDIFVLGFLHLQSTKCTKTLYVASEKCFDENS